MCNILSLSEHDILTTIGMLPHSGNHLESNAFTIHYSKPQSLPCVNYWCIYMASQPPITMTLGIYYQINDGAYSLF